MHVKVDVATPIGDSANLQLADVANLRVPCDVICVIDVSGSMAADAYVSSEDGSSRESHGYNSLDIVKHAVRTLAHSMSPQDRLGLVVFSTEGTT